MNFVQSLDFRDWLELSDLKADPKVCTARTILDIYMDTAAKIA